MIRTVGINHEWSHVLRLQEGRHGHMLQTRSQLITLNDMTRTRTSGVLAGHNWDVLLELHGGR